MRSIEVSDYSHSLTEKKEKILNAALTLFAQDGYKSTSTSKVAKHAGVSEGLIFRHFKNKEGLLQAIILEGEERAKLLFAEIIAEKDPKAVIRKVLEIPQKMTKSIESSNFWKLQYKIKWELEDYNEKKMEPLLTALSEAFKKLDHPYPENEASRFLLEMDGLATRYYLQKSFKLEETLLYLKKRYVL